MITRLFLIFVATSISLFTTAQTLTPTDEGSKVSFTIKNMGINVEGSLSGLKGKINFDPKKLSSSAFNVSVDVSTINTNNEKRDAHLLKSDFFDEAKYPEISIKTTSIQAKANNVYFAKATLIMHGVSKNIQFDFIAKPNSNGYHFTGGFSINRLDYGVGGTSMTMSDKVNIKFYMNAVK